MKPIQTYLSDEERKLIEAGARADSRTISSFLKKCALDKSKNLVEASN